jgi:hypothetical protein
MYLESAQIVTYTQAKTYTGTATSAFHVHVQKTCAALGDVARVCEWLLTAPSKIIIIQVSFRLQGRKVGVE